MILGIGTDLVDIRRIERLLARFGARFEARLFSGNEVAYARAQARPASAYAKRFAAKEAFAKALGGGMRGLNWRDIEVERDAAGKPGLALQGAAAAALAEKRAVAHLSLSDDFPYALAFVVIECP